MGNKFSLSPGRTASLTLVVVAIFSITLGSYASFARGPNDPATECLIALKTSDGSSPTTITCKDSDACDADGTKNGECKIKIQACVNFPSGSCTAQALKPVKVNPKKAGISVTASGTSSVCGAFTDTLILKLKGKKKDKPSKKTTIIAKAKGTTKGVQDVDKIKVQCVKCDQETCAPPTTTTTTTTSTTNVPPTLAPIPTCGNGTIDTANGETCDPGATPNGCTGPTPFCDPVTCQSCGATCSQLSFKLGIPTDSCGFPADGKEDPALPPLSGELRDQNGTKTTAGDLGLGCLYIGGGIASSVPPGPTPDGSETVLKVTDCSVNAIALEPADTKDPRTCTVGPKTETRCTNGHPGTNGQGACTTDADCQPTCVNGHCVDGAPGTDGNGACAASANCGPSSLNGPPVKVCQTVPSCFFGSPLPISNGGLSTCVLNVVKSGVTGTADVAAGSANVTLPLSSWVHLTGLEDDYNPDNGGFPCPRCQNGVCTAGSRKGQACATTSGLQVTHDCPPSPHLFLAPLDVTLGPLSTSTVDQPSSDLGTCGNTGCLNNLPTCCSGNGAAFCSTDVDCKGIFCQGPPVQPQGGAFGRVDVRSIVEFGSPAAGGLDVTAKDATLGSVFCIPPTNNGLIDGAANLPGPGAIGLGGTVRLR
jgi:hypothetical protein